jgi:PadR family transcriptional regulator, regulatory protein PadR
MAQPSDPRMTQTTQAILRALLEQPSRELYGLEICARAELPSGTVHPILARLEKVGWLESSWEETDPRQQGRPRRRYYKLSSDGAERARMALARVTETKAALRRLQPGVSAGGAM